MSRGVRRAGMMSKSFFYAVVVHIVVGVLLLFNLDWPTRVVSPSASEPAPVQANVVSEAEIQKQKEAIREKELAKERKQQEAQEKLEELLEKQKTEQERLAEIKQRQKQEAQKAEELARQKEQEAQELAKLKQKEEEERKKAEAEAARQAEAERQREAEEERKRKEAEEQRRKEEQRQKELAEERERQRELQEQLERERLQQRVNSALAQYIPIIKQKVSRNWNRPAGLGSRIEAHVTVRLSQSGEVLSARIVRSSGNPVFDRSVENAVLKASPLPIPQERGVNEEFRSIKLIFKPEEMIS